MRRFAATVLAALVLAGAVTALVTAGAPPARAGTAATVDPLGCTAGGDYSRLYDTGAITYWLVAEERSTSGVRRYWHLEWGQAVGKTIYWWYAGSYVVDCVEGGIDSSADLPPVPDTGGPLCGGTDVSDPGTLTWYWHLGAHESWVAGATAAFRYRYVYWRVDQFGPTGWVTSAVVRRCPT